MTTSLPLQDKERIEQLLHQLPCHLPRATYRLQLHADFNLDQGSQLAGYLQRLGISDVYASPILTARVGSPHGYDITDHGQINPDLGGNEAFERFSDTLLRHQLGLILDVVPNHMGIGDLRNTWWSDVLENGPSSIYAHYFDIDWDPVRPQLRDKVLLPILGAQYGDVLDAGELKLRYNGGAFFLAYYEHLFPLDPCSYAEVLGNKLDALIGELGSDHVDVVELQSILTALSYLPAHTEVAPEKVLERNREKEVIKRRLANLYEQSEPVQTSIEATLAFYNGTPGQPESFDRLETLIADQPYRLAFWRVATEEINYRRFFDINDLAAIRVELPEVLQATHQLVFGLLAEGRATGLRIDHPDGLWHPSAYFRQLQVSYLEYWAATTLKAAGLEPGEDAADSAIFAHVADWIAQTLAQSEREGAAWPLYVVAEKILSAGEDLPADWAVAGTTGYDFLNEVNGIFVDQAARKQLDRLYTDVAGVQPRFANLVNSKKKEIMLVSLASEINTLSHMLDRLTERNRHYRDFTLNSLTFIIREVIACLPVYRTYISGLDTVTPWDERYVEAAVREAKRRNPRTAETIFNFLCDTLLLRNLDSFAEDARPEVIRFVMKFQQISGPVMAKGVEDTTFYVYNRLVSLNEVGGHPENYGHSVEYMHKHAGHRSTRWPSSMLGSSTHDTKRGEDVRARINVLSELPQEWRQIVSRWTRLNLRKKKTLDDTTMPSRNDEYLLYQTLVGAWPFVNGGTPDPEVYRGEALEGFRERIVQYMEKATREAKVHTSWVNPNANYDAAVRRFVEGVLDPRRSGRFLDSLATFAERVAFFGFFNSLAQTLIKLTAPGVPDIYQGCEFWNLSLVDPDNRRPVDYALRERLLDEMITRVEAGDQAGFAHELFAQITDGRIKLYLTYTVLQLRRAKPELFAEAGYLPLAAAGDRADHVVAFARQSDAGELLTVVPRLPLRLANGDRLPPTGERWGETRLIVPHAGDGTHYRDLFTGAIMTIDTHDDHTGFWMRDVLAQFPVALLEQI
ncbi:malto-oligosyltrehalose synthase [Candidatus Chloroploca asiatica]|uniref:malto-oligosyltrehalose synthase n=1 Tax=Candidatus Chloroploca asiatica TaxID=1506545 RepID=UPI000BEA097F|nr:malto-oligosyltrehalose synthase [Candidatus Chloroploca asiatica]